MFAYEKLDGLDRQKLLSTVEPVLLAHGVRGVELIWRTDNRGWVLYLTLELDCDPPTEGGITLDLCTDVSRDLSLALDVTDIIRPAFRLEVGSPGVERRLYGKSEYDRFRGRLVKLKLTTPVEGEWTLRGQLAGLTEEGLVAIEADTGRFQVRFEDIEYGNLAFDMHSMGIASTRERTSKKNHAPKKAAHGRR